jgi:hypothetical protein
MPLRPISLAREALEDYFQQSSEGAQHGRTLSTRLGFDVCDVGHHPRVGLDAAKDVHQALKLLPGDAFEQAFVVFLNQRQPALEGLVSLW